MTDSPQFARSAQFVEIGGRSVRLTNLGKVLYPSTGTTKGDVIGYYSRIAPVLIPHARDRAATRKRWPDGVGADGSGAFFFQKDIGAGVPDWVETRRIQHKDHVNSYPLVNDEATLVWLAQLATLEIHVPQWRFGRGGEHLNPDRLVFDLDPGPGVGLRECARVAVLVRDILSDMGLRSIPVTSGSKGVHVYAALDGSVTSEQASSIARELARSLEADHPDEVISSMKRSLREGKVFIDWSQNHASKTTIVPYSLRGRARPTVAVPRTWRELASPHLRQLDFREALRRVERRGDPMEGFSSGADEPGPDRLEVYRAKRDRAVTPEPVPERIAPLHEREPGGAPVFVIQRHRARRLHYDFRLEHDGVLASWALPKGVPTDSRRNHLAVPTEDHPMEYRFFEGTIPKGEYGAGEVEIWDAGTYVCEKWRDDEVIATLTGSPGGGLGGTRRFALFRTHEGDGGPRWMIHLMDAAGDADAAEDPGAKDPGAKDPGAKDPGAKDPGAADFAPMLTTLGAAAGPGSLDPGEWAFEMKWDGIRAIATVSGRKVRIRSRSGADITAAYPELQALAGVVAAEDAVLDGEIVSFDRNGAPSFSRLQQRMGLIGKREVDRARRAAPASFLVFDVLRLEGRDCRRLPYRQRRELLAELLDEDPGIPVVVPPAFEGDAGEAVAASRELGLEGIVAKRRESPYRSGVRSPDWVKYPLIETQEVVVIGWRSSEADAAGLASLLVATRRNGELAYAGRVGTGFSAAERRGIRERLGRAERKTAPVEVPAEFREGAHWVTPKLVAEVRHRGLTAEGRLRHPSWRGWRPDRSVEEL